MTTATIPNAPSALAPVRKPVAATRVAFLALILRDLVVLRNGSTVGSRCGGAVVRTLTPADPSR